MASTMASGLPIGSSPFNDASLQHTETTRKRTRSNHVTWAEEVKLKQVRLFLSEDAPSLSGSVLQELLEAKKTKFVHSSVHSSLDDLPPGFECVATKRAGIDPASILAMVAQVTWHCPDQFSLNLLWQVAMGDESSEVKIQRQRELRVLEAVYPRPSAVPSSSMEPLELPTSQHESQVIEIPLLPTDDDDDGVGGDDMAGYSPSKDAQNLSLRSQSEGDSSSAPSQFSSDLTSTIIKNDDPDVAAAAAAAFAVVKAKESGALIDHELLIKILSNPVLIESLTASNPRLRKQFGDISSTYSSGNNSLKIRSEQLHQERPLIGPTDFSNPFHVQGVQKYDPSRLGNSHPWGHNGFPSLHGGRGYLMAGPRGPYVGPPGHQQHPGTRQDYREFTQHQGMPVSTINDDQFRQPDEVLLGHDSEWYHSGHAWAGSNSAALQRVGLGRSNTIQQDKLAVLKTKKQCAFFNTPRGCRNGVHCPFAHDLTFEKHGEERVPDDARLETKLSLEIEDKGSDADPK